jgi:hypothetical protein
MPKTKTNTKSKSGSPMKAASVRLRGGSDLERTLYVTARKALAPRTTITRSRAARAADPGGAIAIPEDKGYAIFPPGRFEEAAEVVSAARERLERLGGPDAVVRDSQRKQFMMPIIEQAELDRDDPIMRLALREDVLSAVSGYLGIAPLLTNINVYLSRSSDRELMSSQLFHCDADDTRQIKIFVLCSSVDEASGPLMIMDAERSSKLRRRIKYTYRNRVTDEEARAALGSEVELAGVMGEPGTVVLVDTSRCFHYGSRVEGGGAPRLAAMIQYLTPYSFMLPRDATRDAPFRGLASESDGALERLALGA